MQLAASIHVANKILNVNFVDTVFKRKDRIE